MVYKVRDSYQNESLPVSRVVMVVKKELEDKTDNQGYVKIKKAYVLDNTGKDGEIIGSLSKGQKNKNY